jgi:hypothetical protein
MMHDKRVWCVAPVASAQELARMLTEMTWCCCNGFELDGYLWLNDSTSPDGAQEYATIKKDGGHGRSLQIESITFGWCDEAQALEYIRRTLAGQDDDNTFRREVAPILQTAAEHGRCHHCA